MGHTVGVLITYHNEKDMLRDCINSLATQTDKPDEILIYDDASYFKASDFVPRDYPVKIIRGPVNRGLIFGRNELLRISTSEYIHFHDVDDIFYPAWCEKVRDVIDTKGVDVVFTEVSSFSNNELVYEHVLGLERLATIGDLVRFAIMGSILPVASTLRRDITVKIGGYPHLWGHSEDYCFHIRLAATGVTHAEILEPLIVKRLRPESRSNSDLPGCWISAVEAVRLLSGEIPPLYHQDLADAAAKLGSKLFISGARREARVAFQLAKELGPPKFSERHKLYRSTARTFGPENAECLGAVYRRILPARCREFLAKQ